MDSLLNTTSISILISLVLLIFSSLFLLFRPSKVGNSREPPKVAGAWPILGHLPLLMRGSSEPLHIKLGAMAEKYGPIFSIKLGTMNSTTLVISNWEVAKECFTTNDIIVSSRPKLVAVENLSYNLAMFGFAPYGPYWRELRKIVTLELLSNRRIELLSHVRVSEVEASIKELFNLWSNSTKIDESGYVLVEMKQWFSQLTFNIVLRMISGKRFFGAMVDVANEEKAKRFLELTREFFGLMGVYTVGDVVPSLRWLDFGGHEKKMKKVANELDEILREWLEEHREQIMGLDDKDSADHTDFIHVMLSLLHDNRIEGFDVDTIIKATTLAMILGGSDTTNVTLTWAVCLLLRNPHVLEKAKQELDIKIGRGKCITESDINKLVYVQAIVKETLRLYPAGPLASPRVFREDCTLGGYHVKKGTQLITNVWKIHTDPCVWSDPMEFRPERFITSHKDVDVRGQHFELLPFGSGRRICPGISFALQMLHFILATFLHSFEILNPSDQPTVDMTGTLGLTHAKATPLEILVKPCLSLKCYETM